MTIAPTEQYPKLRQVEVSQHIQNNELCFQLSDPFELGNRSILVPHAWGLILAMFDGETSVQEMVDTVELHTGQTLDPAMIYDVIGWLDEIFLLENERFREARDVAIDSFRAQSFRQPIIAGSGYPSDIVSLERYLAEIADRRPESIVRPDLVDAVHEGRFGILSPHIDFQRGGVVYSEVWRQARDAIQAADLVILIGTDHKGDDPFTLTRQDYATPFGVLPTAQDVVDKLVDIIGAEAAFAGELRHRTEHSLELPAVWLHHMRGGESVELLPMLVGSLKPFDSEPNVLGGEIQLHAIAEYVRDLAHSRKIAVVASGDLSHVGPAFGDEPLNNDKRAQVQAADEILIDHLCEASGYPFVDAIAAVDNENHVCGIWPTFLMMRLLVATEGELFGYASCPADENNTSAVTIAGMVFH